MIDPVEPTVVVAEGEATVGAVPAAAVEAACCTDFVGLEGRRPAEGVRLTRRGGAGCFAGACLPGAAFGPGC